MHVEILFPSKQNTLPRIFAHLQRKHVNAGCGLTIHNASRRSTGELLLRFAIELEKGTKAFIAEACTLQHLDAFAELKQRADKAPELEGVTVYVAMEV